MSSEESAGSHTDDKVREVHERLAQAVEALTAGEEWRRAIEFTAHFRAHSFNNTLLIWAQHSVAYERGLVPDPMPSYVAGYKQWQQLGRQVQKGQPGYQILAPVTRRVASADPSDATSWRWLGKFEKPHASEVAWSKMIGVRAAYVWDASQTLGDPLPSLPAPTLLEGEAPAGLWDGLAAQVQAAGFDLHRIPDEASIRGANGMTDYGAKTVSVRENMAAAAQVKTLAHELGHVLMHGPDQTESRQHRGIGEVEAESVALMIGAAHGMDTSGYTIPYVSTWAVQVDGKEPVEIVKATGERVRAAAVRILEQLDTTQVGNGRPPGLDRESAQRAAPEHPAVAPHNVVRAAREPAAARSL